MQVEILKLNTDNPQKAMDIINDATAKLASNAYVVKDIDIRVEPESRILTWAIIKYT
jgi:hypothetical protein